MARDIVREVPTAEVEPSAAFEDGAWVIRAHLPSALDAKRFAAGMRSEGLPCRVGDRDDDVYLPLCTSYSSEDVEHLVLGVAKVVHYLTSEREPE